MLSISGILHSVALQKTSTLCPHGSAPLEAEGREQAETQDLNLKDMGKKRRTANANLSYGDNYGMSLTTTITD